MTARASSRSPLAGALLAGLLALSAPTAGAADLWVVDPDASRLGFTAQQNGSSFDGRFAAWQAEIRFDPDDLAASAVRVAIDTTSAATGLDDRDGMLRGSDWFAAGRHPEARFETTGFRHLGGDAYEADGTLTLRGIARPITLPFTLEIDGDTARMDGAVELIRTDFDVGIGQFAAPSPVALEVLVTIAVTARRAG